jgi:hypothetical protein
MKSVIELREEALKIQQEAEGKTANATILQLEELKKQIDIAHGFAASEKRKSAEVHTHLDLTAQAQATLEENGYRVEPLKYPRGAQNPLLYKIYWTY